MTTESEVKLARYNTIEKEADAFGRIIGVRRLKPSEQVRIAEFTSDLTGSDEVEGPDGEKFTLSHRMPLIMAASVCMIDDARIPFPKNRAELDAIFDRLDSEGMIAASAAMTRLTKDDSGKPAEEVAKN